LPVRRMHLAQTKRKECMSWFSPIRVMKTEEIRYMRTKQEIREDFWRLVDRLNKDKQFKLQKLFDEMYKAGEYDANNLIVNRIHELLWP